MKIYEVTRIVVVLGWLILPVTAWAQSPTGAIAGAVTDATGGVLPGVTVEARSPAMIEQARTAVTDGQGRYDIRALRPGIYSVTFTLQGFSTVIREGIVLTQGFTANVDLQMQVGSVQETVTVSGASPVVDVQNVRSQNVLPRETLDALPTNQTTQGFATLTVGASATGVFGSNQDVGGNKSELYGFIEIHGSRANDGALHMDGMKFNSMLVDGGGPNRHYFVNQAAVTEVALATGSMSAESETGGVQLNVVPKDGGNEFSTYVNINGTNGDMQNSNLDQGLKDRFLFSEIKVKKIYDYGIGIGGPLKKDRLWVYTAHRWWGSQEFSGGNFFNATQGTPFYTPDMDRRAFTDLYQRDNSIRFTWQATARHKATLSHSVQDNCNCNFWVNFNRAPEASVDYRYVPVYQTQATWTFPATNRLLFEGGATYMKSHSSPRREDGVSLTDISITELTTGYMWNSASGFLSTSSYGQRHAYTQYNTRFSASYVTGSHAFKAGVSTMSGVQDFLTTEINQDISYTFLNGVPFELTQWGSPGGAQNTLKMNLGLYAQDQWTVDRMTLNLGVRFDYVNGFVPAQTRAAGRYIDAIEIARIDNQPNYKDVSPRLGLAYDLFGDARTALKASLGRYVSTVGANIADRVNPANSISTRVNRSWLDANGNFEPDCDLFSREANGECGGYQNDRFGTSVVNQSFDPAVTEGFGAREYHWQFSTSVQHELRPGMSVTLAYFRTWFGNIRANDNQAVTPGDFDPFCITAPTDSRLPDGGGNMLCDLYDVTPSRAFQIDNFQRLAENFGGRSEAYNGVDLTFRARLWNGGLASGGVNVGRTVHDDCLVVDNPQVFSTSAGPAGRLNFHDARPGFCNVRPPWGAGTQTKLAVAYPLPFDTQIAATLQNLPGTPINATYFASSAEIEPSLERPHTAGGTSIGLYPAYSLFEDRLTQLDLRFTKVIRAGDVRIQGMFDIYNLTNANTVLASVGNYGPAWQFPLLVVAPRLFKIGVQIDY